MSQTQSHSPPHTQAHEAPKTSHQAALRSKYAQNSERAQLLESFWKLSEYSGASRLTGTRQLVSYYSEHARTDAA
jgi:hypothetical protein